MHFESTLSPRRLMTSLLCTLAFKKKDESEKINRKNRIRGRFGGAANSPCGSLLCLPLPALEDWACKKFQLQGLRPASIGTVSKKKKKEKKSAKGTSLRRECSLFALSPATLWLSLWDSGGVLTALSAPRVTPAHSAAPWPPETALQKKLPSSFETESEGAGNVLQDYFLLALLRLITVLHIVFD